jgi:hypothetical protein
MIGRKKAEKQRFCDFWISFGPVLEGVYFAKSRPFWAFLGVKRGVILVF